MARVDAQRPGPDRPVVQQWSQKPEEPKTRRPTYRDGRNGQFVSADLPVAGVGTVRDVMTL